MRTCKICGTENDDDVVFCKMCGSRLIENAKCKLRLHLQGDTRTFVLRNGEHIGANDDSELNKYLKPFPNISKDFCEIKEENDTWIIKNISNNNWFIIDGQIVLSEQNAKLESQSKISFARVSFIADFIEDDYVIEEVYYISCPYGEIELKTIDEEIKKCKDCPRKPICQRERKIKQVKIYAN